MKYLEYIWKSINLIVVSLMLFMLIIVFLNVVLRYGFSSGIRTSVELSRLGLVWVVMLGASIVVKEKSHLAVNEFSEKFFPKFIPILKRLNYLIIFLLMLLLMVGAYTQTLDNWSDISQLTGLPSGLFYLSGIVASFLISLLAILRIFDPDLLFNTKEV